MTKRDKCKQELLKFWDANKGEIINLSIKDVWNYPRDKAYELAEAYVATLECPYCERYNIKVFNDKDITDMNCWRLQCQTCGMGTPELLDLEQVINIWDRFGSLFKTTEEGTAKETKK